MFDNPDQSVAVFDFDELANHLLEHGLEESPALLHGCLCGLLAAGAPKEPEAGLSLMFETLGLNLYGDLADQSMQLYGVSAAALEDEEFDFHPLLPDDETDIESRTAALAHWSKGFLAGFAKFSQSQLDQEGSEILRDFAAITEAAVDEDADEDELESSYMELVEYVRFAALNIYIDTQSNLVAAEEGTGPSIH